MASELTMRIVSAAVLAPLAVGAAYVGGWPFAVFWGAAAVAIGWEWITVTAAGRPALVGTSAVLVLATVLAILGQVMNALVVVGCGTVLAFLLGPERRWWAAAGVLYAGAALMAPVVLRADAELGLVAIVFLFGIVWATDILGYFVGRLVGGPKLWPAVSPKKTWSGALGGALGAMIVGLAIARYGYRANPLAVVGLALLLSAVSQGGDLFESAVKRRFGVKDASHVIPGHGGVMDRLDGFVAAAAVAAVIGIARGGLSGSARGLLIW
jgi:phosphatidate cytidylyltransferase